MNSPDSRSNAVPPSRSPQRRRRLGCLPIGPVGLSFALPILLLLCVLPGVVFNALLVVFEFTFGWMPFLISQLLEVQPSPAEVAFKVMAIVLLAGVLHMTACAAFRPTGNWHLRWTGGSILVMGVLFATGAALAGISRQLTAFSELPEWMQTVSDADTQPENCLRELGLALHKYDDTHHALPASGTFDDFGRPMHSWVTSLLPILYPFDRERSIRLDLPWTAPENRAAFEKLVPMLLLNAAKTPQYTPEGYAVSHYTANVRVMSPNHGMTLRETTDGASHTILLSEAIANPRAWGDPRNARDPCLGINVSPEGFGGPFAGGCHVLMSDGSVRFLSNEIDPSPLHRLATPNNGEPINRVH